MRQARFVAGIMIFRNTNKIWQRL